MVDLSNIHALSDFQRNTKEHLKKLKRSGKPTVLTINGKAELVVQDAESYQVLLDRLEAVQTAELLRGRLSSSRSGKTGRDAEDAIADLGVARKGSRRKA